MFFLSKAKKAYERGDINKAFFFYNKALLEYPELNPTIKKSINIDL